MLSRNILLSFAIVLSLHPDGFAAVPTMIHKQGNITANGVPFDGTGLFKFALVNAAGDTAFWNHEGSHASQIEPTSTISLTVNEGHYAVPLGNTSIPDMTEAISPAVFLNDPIFLRIWFDDGVNGLEQLSPDLQIISVAYAMLADSVVDGSIDHQQIATGAVRTAELATGAVESADINDGTITETDIAAGGVHSLDAADGAPTDAVFVDNDGRVGIGTSTPVAEVSNAALTVGRDGHVVVNNNYGFLAVNQTGTGIGAGVDSHTDDSLHLYAGGANRVTISNTGYVNFTSDIEVGAIEIRSDRNLKENIEAVDPQAVLDRVNELEISRWVYKQGPDKPHMGPMAQDFHAAFGLGGSDKRIATVDADGVALAAIQALTQRLEEREREVAALRKTVNQWKTLGRALEERLSALEARQTAAGGSQ